MINLKIDPEFQSQIPPLTDDEFKQLEENILKVSVKYSLEIQVPIYLICAAEYFRCWASSSCLIIGNMPCMK